MITPDRFLGKVLELFEFHRGVQLSMEFWHERSAAEGSDMVVVYKLPLAEVIGTQFHDKIKASTSGYASFDYREDGYEKAPIQKLNVLLNGEVVDALAVMVHAEQAQYIGRRLVDKLSDTIPRQLFDIAVQAKSLGKVRHSCCLCLAGDATDLCVFPAGGGAEQRQGAAEECDGQVLRRRHDAEEEAADEAEGRQEAHEAVW